MARPLSDGVSYFPKDTDFYSDDKIRLLRAEFGAKGMYLLDYVLCEIYKKDGYFMKWDRSKCYLVSDGAGCGCSPSFADELIAGCIRCGIFDKTVFDKYGVLTSAGIQRRYVRMFNGRDYIRIIKEYFLLNVEDRKDVSRGILEKCVFMSESVRENSDKIKENPDKNKENRQSKAEESKVKVYESKESGNRVRERDSAKLCAFGSFGNVLLSEDEKGEIVSRYGKAVAEELIESFSRKIKSKGYKIKDHCATILLWAEKDGVKKKNGSFDADDFFDTAVKRAEKELAKQTKKR